MDGEREREGEGGERGGGGGGERERERKMLRKETVQKLRTLPVAIVGGLANYFRILNWSHKNPRKKSKFGQKLEKSYNRLKYLEINEHFGNNRLPTIASGRVTQILTIFHYDWHGFFGIKKINDRQY